MEDRPYLSIGDVLALLQREFPDVTISKIRFLESRGLLVPDRTPSGYRKFYEHDVERLRWILRQQREHFLPLKVIKGRLEGRETTQPPALFEMGEETPLSATGHAGQNGLDRPPPSAVFASVPSHARNGALPEPSLQGGASGPSASSGPTAASAASASGSDPAGGAGAGGVVGGGGGAPGAGAGGAGRNPPQASQATEQQTAQAAGPSTSAAESRRDTAGQECAPPAAQLGGAAASEHRRPAAPEGRSAATPRTEETGTGEAGPAREGKGRAPVRESGAEQAPGVSMGRPNEVASLVGVSLTAAELAQASGLEVQQVADLESFGLIEARTVAGVRCFDEVALVVAGLAAGFARFGVEARHLRVFKYAAERQTGLYSQIVLPLLRQRNPDARRRALEDVAQLSDLGVSLQSCFAKAALRDLTGS